jgi:hypothetical protein
VTPNGAIVHQGRPRPAAAAQIRAIGWNAEGEAVSFFLNC